MKAKIHIVFLFFVFAFFSTYAKKESKDSTSTDTTQIRFSLEGISLPLNEEKNKIVYEKIVDLDSINKNLLYNRAYWYMSGRYPNTQFTFEDRLGGHLYFNHKLSFEYNSYFWEQEEIETIELIFTVKLYFKDGRVRYIVSDFHDTEKKRNFTLEEHLTRDKKYLRAIISASTHNEEKINEFIDKSIRTAEEKEFAFSDAFDGFINHLEDIFFRKFDQEKEDEW